MRTPPERRARRSRKTVRIRTKGYIRPENARHPVRPFFDVHPCPRRSCSIVCRGRVKVSMCTSGRECRVAIRSNVQGRDMCRMCKGVEVEARVVVSYRVVKEDAVVGDVAD